MRTIPVGLAAFVGQYSTAWDLLMAGSVIALLPVLVIYVLGQKWFVQGDRAERDGRSLTRLHRTFVRYTMGAQAD
jgi:ABC-type glycerol-3-phosphate transport system permease component